MTDETVTISKEKYDNLVKASAMLSALHKGGVDNWEWYYESLRPYYKKYEPDLFDDDYDDGA